MTLCSAPPGNILRLPRGADSVDLTAIDCTVTWLQLLFFVSVLVIIVVSYGSPKGPSSFNGGHGAAWNRNDANSQTHTQV